MLNNMKIRPLGDRVVVKPIIEDITTKAGIVLPETVEKEKAEKGEVIAVGPGRLLDNGQIVPMSVKVGDKVVFKKYSPDEIKVDDQELLIISEGDILGIIE
jgi:chaperonin GroES